jgi:hypothetical protein
VQLEAAQILGGGGGGGGVRPRKVASLRTARM